MVPAQQQPPSSLGTEAMARLNAAAAVAVAKNQMQHLQVRICKVTFTVEDMFYLQFYLLAKQYQAIFIKFIFYQINQHNNV